MLTCEFVISYKKGDENWFRYRVIGSEDELNIYKETNPYLPPPEEGTLYFVTKFYKGQTGELHLTTGKKKPNTYYMKTPILDIIESDCKHYKCDFFQLIYNHDNDENWLLSKENEHERNQFAENTSGNLLMAAFIREAFSR